MRRPMHEALRGALAGLGGAPFVVVVVAVVALMEFSGGWSW